MDILKEYARMCLANECVTCPFKVDNKTGIECKKFILNNPKKAEEIVKEWSENNPIMIDWLKVPADTKVLVRDFLENEWKERNFALYIPRNDYPFHTFVSGEDKAHATEIEGWLQCRLADGIDVTPYLLEE